jgi:hypothetical protein
LPFPIRHPIFGKNCLHGINRIKLMNFKQLGYCFLRILTNCSLKTTCSLIILNWLLNLPILDLAIPLHLIYFMFQCYPIVFEM